MLSVTSYLLNQLALLPSGSHLGMYPYVCLYCGSCAEYVLSSGEFDMGEVCGCRLEQSLYTVGNCGSQDDI